MNYKNAELATRALVDAKRSAGALAVQEIVVDIASPAEDLRLLRERRPYAQIVELSRNPGFAASCNAGIERARGRHLLVLGSDGAWARACNTCTACFAPCLDAPCLS